MEAKIFLLRGGIMLSIIILFNITFHFVFNKMKRKHQVAKGINSKKYRANIYIFSISLTLFSLFLISYFIYSATKRCERPADPLYISIFILTALIFGHIAQLINLLDEK